MSETEIINQCSSETLKEKKPTRYGYDAIYQVEDKKVVLSFHQYANGDNDYDDELIFVDIKND